MVYEPLLSGHGALPPFDILRGWHRACAMCWMICMQQSVPLRAVWIHKHTFYTPWQQRRIQRTPHQVFSQLHISRAHLSRNFPSAPHQQLNPETRNLNTFTSLSTRRTCPSAYCVCTHCPHCSQDISFKTKEEEHDSCVQTGSSQV